MKTLRKFMVLLLIVTMMIGSFVAMPMAELVAVLADSYSYEVEVKVGKFDTEYDLTSNESLEIAYPELSVANTPAIQVLNGAGNVVAQFVKASNNTEDISTKLASAGNYSVVFGYMEDEEFVRATKNYKIVVKGEKPDFEFVSNDSVILPRKVSVNDTSNIYIPVPNVVDSEGEVVVDAFDNQGAKNADIIIKVKRGSDEITVKTVTEKVDGKLLPYFNVDAQKPGIYTISYSYNQGNVVAYAIREVEVSKTYDESKVEPKVTLDATFPTTLSVGVEKALPAVKVVDKNNSDEDITDQTYTALKVEHFVNGTGTEQAVDGLNFKPTKKLSNGAFYKFTYTVKNRKGEVIDTLVYTCNTCKDDVKPELFIVGAYNNEIVTGTTNHSVAYTITDKNVVGTVDTTNVDYLIPSKINANNTAVQIYIPAAYATDNFVDPATNYEYLKITRTLTWTSGEQTKTIDLSSYPINENVVMDVKTNHGEGTYTLTYKAEDCQVDMIESTRNSVTKTYTIVVSKDVDDSEKPVITVSNDLPKIAIAGTDVKFSEPTVVDYVNATSKDTVDARTHYDYTVEYVNESREVIAGLACEAVLEDGVFTIANITDDARAKEIKVTFKATDYAHRAAGEFAEVVNYITIAPANNEIPALKTGTGFETNGKEIFGTTTFELNQRVEIAEIVYTHSDFAYLTADLTLVDPNGKIVPAGVRGINTHLTTDAFVLNRGAYFTAAKAGEYKLIISVSDINGNTVAHNYIIEVVDNSQPVQTGLKSTLKDKVEVGEKVILPRPIIEKSGVEIEPTTLSVEFIGGLVSGATFNQSTFVFTSEVEIDNVQFYFVVDGVAQETVYSFSVVDNTNPVLEIDNNYRTSNNFNKDFSEFVDDMVVSFPTFNPSDDATGIDTYGIIVTDAEGNEILNLKNEEIAEKFGDAAAYTFTPEEDGVYTVKYYAIDGANNEASETIVFNIGDIDNPDINKSKIDEKISSTMTYKKNLTLDIDLDTIRNAITDFKTSAFIFDDASLVDEEVVNTKGTIKVTLTGPNSTVVANTADDKFSFSLANAGEYTLKIVAKDVAGHTSTYTKTITVASEEYKSKINTDVLGIILIVISVLILAGVVFYFVKTRDRKPKAQKEVKK